MFKQGRRNVFYIRAANLIDMDGGSIGVWLDDLTMLKLRYLTVYCHLHDGNIKNKATLYLGAFVNNRIHTLTLHYFIYIITNHTSINDLGQNVTSIGAILFYSD